MALAVAGSAVLGHQLGLSTSKPPAVTAKKLVVADPYAGGGTWYKGNLHVASVRGVGPMLMVAAATTRMLASSHSSPACLACCIARVNAASAAPLRQRPKST